MSTNKDSDLSRLTTIAGGSIRELRIRETEINLNFLAKSRARMDKMDPPLSKERYDAIAKVMEDGRMELETLLKELKSQ